jgi:chromosome segregation ATPase
LPNTQFINKAKAQDLTYERLLGGRRREVN